MIEWTECKLTGENKSKHCVVIPVYKDFDKIENFCLKQACKILYKWDICFVTSLELEIEGNDNYRVAHINSEYLNNIKGYNTLCKTKEFYELFSEYEYMLIYQLDCWVFEDKLEYWCEKGYDYIGAPWFKVDDEGVYENGVGNGGFSLRKIQTFIDLLGKIDDIKEDLNEDLFFCVENKDKLKIPDCQEASLFSLEVFPEYWYIKNGKQLPMGCHKWWGFSFRNFWKQFILKI